MFQNRSEYPFAQYILISWLPLSTGVIGEKEEKWNWEYKRVGISAGDWSTRTCRSWKTIVQQSIGKTTCAKRQRIGRLFPLSHRSTEKKYLRPISQSYSHGQLPRFPHLQIEKCFSKNTRAKRKHSDSRRISRIDLDVYGFESAAPAKLSRI